MSLAKVITKEHSLEGKILARAFEADLVIKCKAPLQVLSSRTFPIHHHSFLRCQLFLPRLNYLETSPRLWHPGELQVTFVRKRLENGRRDQSIRPTLPYETLRTDTYSQHRRRAL